MKRQLKRKTQKKLEKIELLRPYIVTVKNPQEKRRAIELFQEATGCKYSSELSRRCVWDPMRFPQYVGLYCGQINYELWKYTLVCGAYQGRNEIAIPFAMVKYLNQPEELMARLPKPITIKLNDSYTATVQDSAVVVGCQKFTFDVIDQLVAAVNVMRDASK